MKGKKGVEITWQTCGKEFYWIEADGPYFGGVVRKDNCERPKHLDDQHSLVWPLSSTQTEKQP